MTKETEYTCNQCGKELLHVSYPNSTEIWVCTNPECPNFAILQIPAKFLPVNRDLKTKPSTGKGGGE
jgi:ssDNA-binding Zn-finger/Zn-ribbon topoisomerase 1